MIKFPCFDPDIINPEGISIPGLKKIAGHVKGVQKLIDGICVSCNRGSGSSFGPKTNPDPDLCSSEEGRFLKFYRMNILDTLESLFFFIFSVSSVSPRALIR